MIDLIRITEASDPRLDAFRSLPARRREAPETLVVESELAVGRLLESEAKVHSLLATPGCVLRLGERLRPGLRVFEAEGPVLNAVLGYDMHRGCVAHAERPSISLHQLDAVCVRERGTVVVVAGVSDPANLGAVVRNARALGADAVVVDTRGADPYERRAIRASMGNVFAMPVIITDAQAALVRLRQQLGRKLKIAAATLSPQALPVTEVTRPSHLAIVLGNEGSGLGVELLRQADFEITIPVDPAADSLNVAAASAILLYALR